MVCYESLHFEKKGLFLIIQLMLCVEYFIIMIRIIILPILSYYIIIIISMKNG